MIAMTNANMKNLPTTPAPAPEKSWDKRDRAVKAAIAELGPQAIPEFDFTIIKCDKRYMWRAIAADKRPPISDAQVKANGGKARPSPPQPWRRSWLRRPTNGSKRDA